MSGCDPDFRVLSSTQRLLWPQLRPAKGLGLVLYGGTAIALRLGHRESIDFTFCSDRRLDVSKLDHALPFLKSASVLQSTEDTLKVLVRPAGNHATVRLSFFGDLSFGRVSSPDETADGVLQIASLLDLMAIKLKQFMRRSQANDYLDLAAMIEANVSLPYGLAGAREMFGPAFQPSEALKAMAYYPGGGLASLPQHTARTLINAVATVDDLPTAPTLSQTLGMPPDS